MLFSFPCLSNRASSLTQTKNSTSLVIPGDGQALKKSGDGFGPNKTSYPVPNWQSIPAPNQSSLLRMTNHSPPSMLLLNPCSSLQRGLFLSRASIYSKLRKHGSLLYPLRYRPIPILSTQNPLDRVSTLDTDFLLSQICPHNPCPASAYVARYIPTLVSNLPPPGANSTDTKAGTYHL